MSLFQELWVTPKINLFQQPHGVLAVPGSLPLSNLINTQMLSFAHGRQKGRKSCLQRLKVLFLKALQWEQKTSFQREWILLIHSWCTCKYWRQQYLLKSTVNILHIHSQTTLQERKQYGHSGTVHSCTCSHAVGEFLHYTPGIKSACTCCGSQGHYFHYKQCLHSNKPQQNKTKNHQLRECRDSRDSHGLLSACWDWTPEAPFCSK